MKTLAIAVLLLASGAHGDTIYVIDETATNLTATTATFDWNFFGPTNFLVVDQWATTAATAPYLLFQGLTVTGDAGNLSVPFLTSLTDGAGMMAPPCGWLPDFSAGNPSCVDLHTNVYSMDLSPSGEAGMGLEGSFVTPEPSSLLLLGGGLLALAGLWRKHVRN